MGIKATLAGRRAYMAHVNGNQLSDQGKYSEAEKQHALAVKLYEEAMQNGMANPSYLMAYSVLLLRTREYEKSKEIMLRVEKMALSADQKKQLRQNYAICLWKMGKLDKAIELLSIAASEGKTSWLYGSLGYMLIEKAKQTGDYEEALALNMEGLEYDDEDAVVLDNLGQLYLNIGDREKAREHFKKALKFKPSQVDTLYYLALMAHQDGDDGQAKAYLESAISGNYSALCTTTREQAVALLREVES